MLINNFKTELQLLIACCKAAFDNDYKQFVYNFIEKQTVDWNDLLQLSAIHSVRPLLLKGLLDLQTNKIPADFKATLSEICEKINIHNTLFSKELFSIMDAMKNNHITIVPYKGIALIHTVYKAVGLREFGDMDLLMYASDIPMMKKTMANLGYKNEFDWTDDEEVMMLRVNSEYNFSLIDNLGTHYRVEPHYQAAHPTYSIDLKLKHIENHIFIHSINNHNIPFFSPTASLILLLPNHGVSEGWTTLKYLFDMHLLIKDNAAALDWNFIIQEAKRMSIYNNMLIGFGVIQNVFQTPLPIFLTEFMRKPSIQQQIVERVICLNEHEKVTFKTQFKKGIFNLKSRDNMRVRLKMCFYQLFMPNNSDFIEIKFHKNLFFLYFMLRPFRILYWYFGKKNKIVKKKQSY
ncbi:MAG: hypothetical protein RIS64_2580 [Bacteroidota bacterium]|jgi:hypothetical protein